MLGPNIRRACSTLLRPAVAVVFAAVLLNTPELTAAPKKPREFGEGIKAQDGSDWKRSAELMAQAVSQQPEDGAPTRIYGTRFLPYLPLYYLGLAHYKQGNCAEAVKQWERCLQTGFVQSTEMKDLLLRYRAECMSASTSPR